MFRSGKEEEDRPKACKVFACGLTIWLFYAISMLVVYANRRADPPLNIDSKHQDWELPNLMIQSPDLANVISTECKLQFGVAGAHLHFDNNFKHIESFCGKKHKTNLSSNPHFTPCSYIYKVVLHYVLEKPRHSF